MTGSEIVQIVSLVLTAIVSIVTLLVRARIITLEGEVKELHETLKAANALIIDQGVTINTLSAWRTMEKDNPYEAMPPYRKP